MIKIPELKDFPKKLNAAQVKVIILESIINPIFTDNGNRADRATSLPKYEIKKSGITGQFIASQGKLEALFDFDVTKSGGEWELGYGYAEEELKTADIATIKDRLRGAIGKDFTKLFPSNYETDLIKQNTEINLSSTGCVVLRNILIANNLFDRQNAARKSSRDLLDLFDSALGRNVSISNSDRSIQGVIFDIAYSRTGIPADKITRSKNNDFIVITEGYISVFAAIACEANDLADFDQTDMTVTVM